MYFDFSTFGHIYGATEQEQELGSITKTTASFKKSHKTAGKQVTHSYMNIEQETSQFQDFTIYLSRLSHLLSLQDNSISFNSSTN